MEGSILFSFLLILNVLLNLNLNAINKHDRFSKIFPIKDFEYASIKYINLILFNTSFVLLAIKVYLFF